MSLPFLNSKEILRLRGRKNVVRPEEAYAAIVEKELSAEREIVRAATIFITNKECPFRCLMCDLWKNTLDEKIETGLIPKQIESALADLGSADHIKLYNSGNFFDAKAIPREDLPAIASICVDFKRVIVESHPKFIAEHAIEFRPINRRRF